jgi:hypothetical protein
MRLNQPIKMAFYGKMEKLVGAPIVSMNVGKIVQSTHVKGLIIQDELDDVVSIAAGKQLYQDWQESQLFITHGLGHRKILHDESVAKKICEFFAEP